jgi:thiamine pyrophosphokinase
MKSCVLFLHGRYQSRDFPFYRRLCRGRVTVAVDGGYRFFRRANLVPDVLIGDLDSLGGLPRDLDSRTRVIRYRPDKDRTDAHLAIDFCREERAREILIVQPSTGEPDQMLGNFLLPAVVSGPRTGRLPQVSLVGPDYVARLVSNGKWSISNAVGRRLSVLPLSRAIRLTCRGTEYRADRVRLRRGHTMGLRNMISARRASVEIEGDALVLLLGRIGRGGSAAK